MVFQTIDIPKVLDTMIDVPVVQVVQLPGSFTRRGAEAADSHGPDCSSDQRVSPVLGRQGDRCPCCTGCAGFCRGAELIPMVLLTMEIPSCSSTWWLRPWCAGPASSTGAVVEESAALPLVHLS